MEMKYIGENILVEVLRAVERGKTQFKPKSQETSDLEDFQPIALALIHAADENYIERVLPHETHESGRRMYDVVMADGLTFKGQRFLKHSEIEGGDVDQTSPQEKVRVFVSWSSEPSEKIALALKGLFENINPKVKLWVSSEDIKLGARWGHALADELEQSDFGIVCFVRGNVQSPWVLFESGAIAKSVSNGRLIPLLHGIDVPEMPDPLKQFQGTSCDRTGVLKTLKRLNKCLKEPMSDQDLEIKFDRFWEKFESSLPALIASSEEYDGGNGKKRARISRQGQQERDRRIYQDFITRLPSSPTMRFVREQDFGSTYDGKRLDPLIAFLDKCDGAEHQFSDVELERLRKSFFVAAAKFTNFEANNTWPVGAGKSEYRSVSTQKMGKYDPAVEASDKSRAEKLNRAADVAYKAHQALVKQAGETLGL